MKKSPHRIADKLAPLMFLVALSIVLSIARPSFASQDNVLTMVRQSAVIIILAVGQTILMISGGIDLSVGSVLALSTVAAGFLHQLGMPPVVCGLAALGAAALTGLINGLVTTRARVPAFVATLGMMGMARGLALILSQAVTLSIPEVYGSLGSHVSFFGICLLIVVVTAHLCLTKTTFGRHVYAVGGNKEAARLSGVNTDKHLIKAFVINGVIVGVAAVLLLARLGIASPTSGEGYELDSIAAAVIGGTSLFGGQGTVGGSIIGALIMTVLRNGCDQLNVDIHWQMFVIGAMIILAVCYDGMRRKGA